MRITRSRTPIAYGFMKYLKKTKLYGGRKDFEFICNFRRNLLKILGD